MKRGALAELSGISIEGGALSTSVLRSLMERKLEASDANSYHLEEGYTVGEKVAEEWNRVRSSWKTFSKERDRLGTEPGAGFTRDKLLLPLFERLGYGRLPYAGGLEAGGERYSITHSWGNVPIHLIGADTDLDSRSSGVAGAAKRSPHSLVLEYLNRGEASPWGFVANGKRLRLLRENRSIVRQSYIEFDLEGIIEGESYADFTALWLLCHQSRLEGKGEAHILERWRELGIKEGERALDELRVGMEKTISSLGTGLIAHPANTALRGALSLGAAKGGLDTEGFYHELLRLAYRLIFLFVAEDRDVLLDPKAPAEARQRYGEHYSTRRLRELAQGIRGGGHGDLWRGLVTVMELLADKGCPDLALPVFGSFLWESESIAHLASAQLANRDLLGSLRDLAFTRRNEALWPTDFRNLGSEELGSVYESLLELHPELNLEGGSFKLATAAGHERKTTGSYYTPTSLVERLLDEALDPVVEAKLANARRMASGEWEMVEREFQEVFSEYINKRLQGPGSVDARKSDGKGRMASIEALTERGTLWTDVTDQTGGGFDTSEYSGGVGTPLPGGIHPVPAGGQRQQDGIGDPSGSDRRLGTLPRDGSETDARGIGNTGKAIAGIGKKSEEANGERRIERGKDTQLEKRWTQLPFPIRYSLFAEFSLLSLKVCDPAMGSGHFLAGAARRIAKALASSRTGESEPGPEPLRHAMADVVQNCIYGVDINPLAVELCKISLWMEALEPGQPLSFLDHHLKCGNSLVGATRELMATGIPEGAFALLTGDDKDTVRAAKKRNNEELGGAKGLFDEAEELFPDYAKIAERFSHLQDLEETTLEGVRLLATRYRSLVEAPEYLAELSAANGWCAAFFQAKRQGVPEPITQGRFSTWLRDPTKVAKPLRDLAEGLSARAGFFHWELAFPEVFRRKGVGNGEVGNGESNSLPSLLATPYSPSGGFDVVLGNPPWDQVQFREEEWFAERNPEIALATTADRRKKMIAKLEKDDPSIFKTYLDALRDVESTSSFLKDSGRYPLCGRGKINLFSVFTELARSLLAPTGRLGIIVPSGIATDDTTKDFFADLVEKRVLVSLYDFENHGIFPAVHNSYKFCLLAIAGSPRPAGTPSRFVFFAHSVAELEEPERLIELTDQDFLRMNPNTKTAPIFRSRRDAEITRRVYERVPVLIREGPPEENPWGLSFRQGLFNMASDSGLFRTREELEAERFRLEGNRFVKGKEIMLPLYEAKMIHHFDHRWATYDGTASRDATETEKIDPGFEPLPRYWVEETEVTAKTAGRWDRDWFIGWRDICRSTDRRTAISSVIPRAGVGDKFLLMLPNQRDHAYCLAASIDSFAHDFIARQKVGGTSLKYFTFKQLPILPPSAYSVPCPWELSVGTVADWIKPRVLELVYTSWSLLPFAVDAVEEGVGNREVESREERVIAYWKHHFPNSLLATPYSPSSPFPPSPFAWEPERRFALRCELDAAFFHLYGIGRDDADYILETFPIVKRHDEQEFGQYRTKRVILERYEEYAGAMGRQNPAGFDLGQVMANAIAETMPIRESGAPTASTSSKASSAAPKVRVYEEAPTFEKRDTDEVEWMCEIRKLFSTGGARDRDTAIKELATALGYERVGPVIGETISNAFTTAVKRGVIENEGGSLKLLRRNLYEYFLDFLKDQFLAALEGNSWREHDDAIRGFARWMGYAKTSPQIDEKARSIINGLIRENRLEAEGTRIRRGF